MKIKQLSVNFHDSVEEDVRALVSDMQLVPVAKALQSGAALTPEVKQMLTQLFSVVADLFSADMPYLPADPEDALRAVSRDINLSRLLKERGIFRLFLFLNRKDEHGVPSFMSIMNPLTDAPFASQEEFINWFCREAHIARSMIFVRLRTIERIISLGRSLEDAFDMVVSKPHVVRETLNLLADWNGGGMESIDPDVALKVAQRVNAPELEKLERVAQAAKDNPDDKELRQELTNLTRPALSKLLDEITVHPNARDAMEFVKYDVLAQPEIRYVWDAEAGALLIKLIRKQVGPDGCIYDLPETEIIFAPDVDPLPEEIKADLIKRLPVRNKFRFENLPV